MDKELRTEAKLENVRGQTSNSVMSENPDLHDKSKYSQFTRRSLGSHHQRFNSVDYIHLRTRVADLSHAGVRGFHDLGPYGPGKSHFTLILEYGRAQRVQDDHLTKDKI